MFPSEASVSEWDCGVGTALIERHPTSTPASLGLSRSSPGTVQIKRVPALRESVNVCVCEYGVWARGGWATRPGILWNKGLKPLCINNACRNPIWSTTSQTVVSLRGKYKWVGCSEHVCGGDRPADRLVVRFPVGNGTCAPRWPRGDDLTLGWAPATVPEG